ncbi:hypothetical protein BC835DRAFT_193875 [Cytidiella melzeri]|nr:hypothetical protein BC835DRAFT_193875 [Cytidiella melzeri]
MPIIAEGVYKIVNAKARSSVLTMDVSLALAPTYVFGHPWIDGDCSDQQKWLIENAGDDGYTIKNVGTQKFLSLAGNPGDGAVVYGTWIPTSWTFKYTKIVPLAHRIFAKDTWLNIDLDNWGDSTPGTGLKLWGWENDNDRPHQCWFLEPMDEEKPTTCASESSKSALPFVSSVSRGQTHNADETDKTFMPMSDGDTRDEVTTRGTSETATVTVSEDEEYVVTTRTSETKTTIVTKRAKRVG